MIFSSIKSNYLWTTGREKTEIEYTAIQKNLTAVVANTKKVFFIRHAADFKIYRRFLQANLYRFSFPSLRFSEASSSFAYTCYIRFSWKISLHVLQFVLLFNSRFFYTVIMFKWTHLFSSLSSMVMICTLSLIMYIDYTFIPDHLGFLLILTLFNLVKVQSSSKLKAQSLVFPSPLRIRSIH